MANCIYKYKGKDYTKEEFYSLVSSSNFIQQEQVKKFAELQERLNNKEFLEGAKNAFESSEELQQFGTQEKYNDYLARVSLGIIKNPSSGGYNYNSEVSDIVYHGTSNLEKVKNEGFNKSKLKTGEGTNLQGAGFYFAKFKQVLSNYAKGEKGGFVQAVVNLKNPLQEHNFPKFLERELNEKNVSLGNVIEVGQKVDNWLNKNKKDGVIWNQTSSFKQGTAEQETAREKLFGTAYNKTEKTLDVEHYSVIEPEQIHILGSKQDIEGFRKFVDENKNVIETSKNPITDLIEPYTEMKLIDGKFYNKYRINSELLLDLGYTVEEAGEILKEICK
jgi:hypothetical protein